MKETNRYYTKILFYDLNESSLEGSTFEDMILDCNINSSENLKEIIRELVIPTYNIQKPDLQAKIITSLKYCIVKLEKDELNALFNSVMPLLYFPDEYDIRNFYKLVYLELTDKKDFDANELLNIENYIDLNMPVVE